jgi:hypothetical protein
MTGKDHSNEDSASVEVHAVVDRIEDGDIAVLTLDDETESQLDLPRGALPKDANSGGDHLLLKFDVDRESGERTLKSIKAAPQARDEASERIKKMQERLARMGGASKGKKNFKL